MKKVSRHIYFLVPSMILFSVAGGNLYSQVTWSSANNPYNQNFGTSTIGSWTDNSTFPGWYAISYQVTAGGTDAFQGTVDITAAAPSNNGGWYIYQCSGGGDMKLGTRPSNNCGGPDNPGLDGRRGDGFGVCLQNNFGASIQSITVDFDWYQLSLAQNGNIANQNFFSYFVSTSSLVTADLPNNAHVYTNVAAGNFTAPNDDAAGGSLQDNGYPCTVSGHNSFCIPVTIAANSYIMLRWWDPNNSNNDPHLAIDNVSVKAFSDNACVTPLPVELVQFSGTCQNGKILLDWQTASEINNHYFIIEKSFDAYNWTEMTRIEGNGNSNTLLSYSGEDLYPQTDNYYRLKQVDFDGKFTIYDPISIQCHPAMNPIVLYPNPSHGEINIVLENKILPEAIIVQSAIGATIQHVPFIKSNGNNIITLDLSSLQSGVYCVRILVNDQWITKSITIVR